MTVTHDSMKSLPLFTADSPGGGMGSTSLPQGFAGRGIHRHGFLVLSLILPVLSKNCSYSKLDLGPLAKVS